MLSTLYAQDPERRVAALAARPEVPMEVSYVERRTDPPSPRRYDVILASSEWRVLEAVYDYERAVAAGSDHGLIAPTTR